MQSKEPHIEKEFWERYDETEQRLTAEFSERMLDLAGIDPGMKVLDIATGRGEPAIRAANRVGPSGMVIGIDRSGELLELAAERARREGVTNLELRVMDAENLNGIPDGWADVALIRWGLMYFDSPGKALRGIRRALVPGGRLVVAVWADPEQVDYISIPREVRSRYVKTPEIDRDTPGPFYYSDPERLTRDLESAGFFVRRTEEVGVSVMEAGTVEEFVEWVLAFGDRERMRCLAPAVQSRWQLDLRRVAEDLRANGGLKLGGVSRLVVSTAHP